MKRNLLFIGILILLFGCKKNKEDQYKNYKIKSIRTTYADDIFYKDYLIKTKKQNFFYDSKERLIEEELIISDTTLHTYFQYNDSFIVMQYPAETWCSGIDTLFLNPEGLCIKRVSDCSDTINYEYDSEGFLIQDGYTISNGNVVEYSRIFRYPGEDITEQLVTSYDYSDDNNTIYNDGIGYYGGNNNIGIYFWGNQNKNLLKSTFFNLGTGSGITKYSYEFDKKNRVVKMKISYDDNLSQTKYFEYYD